MSEEEIKINIGADDNTAAAFISARKNAEEMGGRTSKATEAAKLGFWSMGEAAENAAQSIGVPNQAARQMGNAVESLASKMGALTVGLGVMGLALTAGYSVWTKLKEAQQRSREELIKGAQASGQWIMAALSEHAQSEKMVKIKKDMAKAEFDLARIKIEAGLPALKQTMDAKIMAYNEAVKTEDRIGSGLIPNMIYGTPEKREKARIQAKADMDKAITDYRLMLAQREMFTPGNRDEIAESAGVKGARSESEIMLAIERDKYNALQELRYEDNQKQIAMYAASESLQRTHTDAMLNTMGSALSAYAAATGKNAKAVFIAQKALAMAQIWVDTGRAAMSAAATAAVLGPQAAAAAAASMWSLGKVNMAIVAATTIAGLSQIGKGGGSVAPQGVYSANPYTGSPASSGTSVNLTLVVNGQSKNIGTLTEDVLRTIYNNNGSIGGLSVSVERTA